MEEKSSSDRSRKGLPSWSQRISRLRLERGWTQEKLAEKVGSDVKSIRRWEKGLATPQLYFRQKLAEVFDATQITLGFLEEVPQEQAPRVDSTLQVPEEPAYKGQEPEIDDLLNLPHGVQGTVEPTIIDTVIFEMPDEFPEQRDGRDLFQKHILWLRPLLFIFLLVIIGAWAAVLLYFLFIKPYLGV